jgi:hypothetical protein
MYGITRNAPLGLRRTMGTGTAPVGPPARPPATMVAALSTSGSHTTQDSPPYGPPRELARNGRMVLR